MRRRWVCLGCGLLLDGDREFFCSICEEKAGFKRSAIAKKKAIVSNIRKAQLIDLSTKGRKTCIGCGMLLDGESEILCSVCQKRLGIAPFQKSATSKKVTDVNEASCHKHKKTKKEGKSNAKD